MNSNISIDLKAISDFCKKNHIAKMALFGSVLNDNFGPESDIDILVEFEAGYTPGFAFFSMEQELSEIVGRRVDLNTPNFLSRYFRDQVIKEAEFLYEAA